METFRKDFQLAIRMLAKRPGFTAIAVLTLALGIAVNATMFSMVSGFLLQRPPGRDPEHVAVVAGIDPAQGYQTDARTISAPNYLAWRESNHVFESAAAIDPYRTISLTLQKQSEPLRAAAVSPNYFDVLSVTPQLGRTFEPGEDQAGRDHMVILSHRLWASHFASDPSVIGRTIRLSRETYTVIGVMPASFRLLGFTEQVWIPLTLTPADQAEAARKDRSLYLFARLKPGVTVEQAQAEMATLAHRAEETFPDAEKGWGASVRTLPGFLIYNFDIRNGIAVLMTTVGFVLLIACANVAGLLLARAAGRRKELAIRGALGAGRLRIIRQLLTEGLVIAVLGGGLGLLFSDWGIKLVRANLSFNEAISAVPLSLDRNVVLFTVGISLLCAVLCSLAPALSASRTDITSNLKDESRSATAGRSQGRLRSVMVTAEIALALFLLVGTGLLFHGISAIDRQNLGFRPDHILTAAVALDHARYPDAAQQVFFVRDLLARLQQLPGAQSVAVTSDLPASGPGSVTLRIKDQPDLPTSERLSALDFVVTPEYFQTTSIALLRGRTFAEADAAAAPRVILVNQEFARRFLKGKEPLGTQIRLDVSGVPSDWSEIVGVVANVKSYSQAPRDDPEVYEPYAQRPVPSFSMMIRTTSDPKILASDLRNAVAQLDPELPLAQVLSMPAVLDVQKEGNPFFLRVLGTFAVLALVLASIGIYGLIAYSVGQRTHEIGIRMALGARGQDVLRMVIWEGMKMAAIGGAVGLVLALPLPKVFESMFFDLPVGEPRLYFFVPAAVLIVAILATYIPARRAAKIDPMTALRQE